MEWLRDFRKGFQMKNKKSSRKWWWMVIPVVLILGVGAFLVLPRLGVTPPGMGQAANVQTDSVSKLTVTDKVEASGSIQPVQSDSLPWKTTGTVAKVNVKVGDQVKAGEVLLELDPTTAPANIISAQSDLINAQKSLDDLKNSQTAQAQALKAVEDAQKAYDNRELTQSLKLAQAEVALVNAQKAYDQAAKDRKNLNYNRASESTLDAANANYLLALAELDQAQGRYDQVSGRPEDDLQRALALSNLSAAKQKRDHALAMLNWYKAPSSEQDIQKADATLAQTTAQLEQAKLDVANLKAGLSQADVALLAAQLADARRAYDQIKDGPNPTDIATLEARIAAAQATLNSLKITAPFDGEVLVLNNMAGDVVNAGEIATMVANRQNLYVEVQVDESDIASVKNGDPADITVDVLPDTPLKGLVTTINPVGANIANLVKYAVRVDLQDVPAQMLLGSTADVSIQIGAPSEKMVVAINAVQNDSTGEYVMKQGSDGKPVRVDVTSGEIVGDKVVVSGNLQVGDKVIINNVSQSMQQMQTGGFGQ
jgi:HlyD family secretion protein